MPSRHGALGGGQTPPLGFVTAASDNRVDIIAPWPFFAQDCFRRTAWVQIRGHQANRQACPNAEGRTGFQGEEPNITRRPPLCGAGPAAAGHVTLYFAPVCSTWSNHLQCNPHGPARVIQPRARHAARSVSVIQFEGCFAHTQRALRRTLEEI